ncbi:MAG TPA: hypothetical protein PKK99_00405 [Bacteroidia bacterium]|nr:hypothetical protein [Bacteroidia bacterium]HNP97479.1 hypothetical protein [Bacteroidia bacterium]
MDFRKVAQNRKFDFAGVSTYFSLLKFHSSLARYGSFYLLCRMSDPEKKRLINNPKELFKRVGLLGFLFFLIKGLMWLAFGYFLLK